MTTFKLPLALPILLLGGLMLAGCNTFTRLNTLGETPPLSQIKDPTAQPGYQPVSMPVPLSDAPPRQIGSIWQPGARAFFKDQRASRVGDVLTVAIAMNDSAKLNNETTRNRTNTENAGLTSFFGLQTKLSKIFPSAVDPTSLVDANSATATDGKGVITRAEQINLRVAAMVSQVLPSGNLVIIGKQEMRVNFDVRELQITGVIRPQDIDAVNSITYDKIAEARISYGGRGETSDIQQPRYGQQLFDTVMPF
jgi:flagellar L-ring protein precursor FlgH